MSNAIERHAEERAKTDGVEAVRAQIDLVIKMIEKIEAHKGLSVKGTPFGRLG